jgi:hypothetical protein
MSDAGGHVGDEENVMSLELSAPQQSALDSQTEEPVRVVDPRTQQTYVLLRADLYERVKEILEEAEEEAVRLGIYRAALRNAAGRDVIKAIGHTIESDCEPV